MTINEIIKRYNIKLCEYPPNLWDRAGFYYAPLRTVYINSALSEKGKELQEKYKALWEIHSIKEYPKNLDDDFQDWDYNKFMIKRHKENIEYSKASYKYHKDLLEFFRNFYPKTEDQIAYYQDQCTFYLNEIDKLNARIEALQS